MRFPAIRFTFLLAFLGAAVAPGYRFSPDDPVMRSPAPKPVGKVAKQKLGDMGDFMSHTFGRPGEKHAEGRRISAQGVNTLGEVPDGPWYGNRHSVKRMTIAELIRGAGDDSAPSLKGSLTITAAKAEGVSPGFQVKDAEGRKYLLKFDPPSNPEMATAADVIVSKFLHALGYHVPQNYIVTFDRRRVELGQDVEFVDPYGRKRRMTEKDLDHMLARVPRDQAGHYRAMASLMLPGESVGPFRFFGVRPDDPNDLVPHEHRRELRGLFVFAAWLGHHDAKALNTLDTTLEENGVRFVKHHLIDFGSALGSASTTPKGPRAGNEYLLDMKPALVQFLTLGLAVPRWARADYPNIPAAGRFEWKMFEPEKWKPNYPNPAFLNRLPDDTFWAAKQAAAFTDEEIRALVDTGQFSDRQAAAWITTALIARRDKIARAYFNAVLPLDKFAVAANRLEFEDLGVKYDVSPPRRYAVQWFDFDNNSERKTPLPERATLDLPPELLRANEGAYFAAEIHAGDPRKTVTVYLRRSGGRPVVVGIERTWPDDKA